MTIVRDSSGRAVVAVAIIIILDQETDQIHPDQSDHPSMAMVTEQTPAPGSVGQEAESDAEAGAWTTPPWPSAPPPPASKAPFFFFACNP